MDQTRRQEVGMTLRSLSPNGFTLIEVAAVILLMSILAVAVVTTTSDTMNEIHFEETMERMRVVRRGIIGDPTIREGGVRASFGFAGDHGNVPMAIAGLIRILTMPAWAINATAGTGIGWNGAYVPESVLPNANNYQFDAWGTALVYNTAVSPVTITSYGSDGVAGGTGYATDIVAQIPSYLLTTTAHVFVSRTSSLGATNLTHEVRFYYPLAGVLQTSSSTQVAGDGMWGYHSFANIPLGYRSFRVCFPDCTAPATSWGPIATTVDKVNFVVPLLYSAP